MTGPPSSSYPGQVPLPAALISPENEEKSSGFDRNFAGFVLRRPATDSGKGDSAGISAESLVPLILFGKRGHSFKE
ncbi:unnamed protein product [Prunus armeniaca]